MKKMFTESVGSTLGLILLVVSACYLAYAHSGGQIGQTLKSSPTAGCGARITGGGSCHGTTASSSVQVSLSGPQVLPVGVQGTYTISLAGTSGPGGGLDIAASSGSLNTSSTLLKLDSQELTHTAPLNTPYAIDFSYTSNSPGTVTIYANGKGSSGWNWAPSLFVRVGPPPAPVLTSPSNGEIGTSTVPTLSWSGTSGASSTVEVSTSSSFATSVVLQNVDSGSSYTIPFGTLLNNTDYYWRVKSTDGGGTSPWSSPVWTFHTSATAVEEIAGAIPSVYGLTQNFPNPFNPSTQIRFALPVESTVSLFVYDAEGREVMDLVHGSMAAGHYAVTLQAGGRGLASGVYFYRLSASPLAGTVGGFTETKKCLLLK